MSVASAVAAGRRAAEARMTSRVAIRRLTGGTTKVDGYEVPEWATVGVGVPFRLKGGANKAVTIGGVEFSEATGEGNLPAAWTDLADSDLLEITAGEWVGSVFRVVEAVKGDQQTARRVPVVEVPRPEEWS